MGPLVCLYVFFLLSVSFCCPSQLIYWNFPTEAQIKDGSILLYFILFLASEKHLKQLPTLICSEKLALQASVSRLKVMTRHLVKTEGCLVWKGWSRKPLQKNLEVQLWFVKFYLTEAQHIWTGDLPNKNHYLCLDNYINGSWTSAPPEESQANLRK